MIKKLLAKLTIDKYLHFMLAAITACILKNILMLITYGIIPIVVAFLVTTVLCIGKELIYDKWAGKGTPEWLDLIIGVLGVLIGVL